MQTFLPFADFQKSVALLDKRRCWKQCVEARQILDVLLGNKIGWGNHPAVKMWASHPEGLMEYYNVAWTHSVNKHGVKAKKLQIINHAFNTHGIAICPSMHVPAWFGSEEFHQSHINNLARKAIAELNTGRPELYDNMVAAGLNPNDQDVNGAYVWPV